MNTNDRLVLILEDVNVPLTYKKDSNDDIVLEGTFTKFGVLNSNNRIYEEEEYFPHLKRLQEKIQTNNLLGELDHPDRLEISLSKVSHKIESLYYNKATRSVIGKLRLLNTPQGEIAKKLIESGVTLSISSRAVGIVKPDKKVKIQMLQTYDLVADPGFKEAGLKKINESLGIYDDNIAIYDITDENPEIIESLQNDLSLNKNINNNMNKYVTEEELNSYSLLIKEDFNRITEKLNDIEKNIDNNNQYTDIDKLKEKINKLERSVNRNEIDNKKLNEIKDYVVYLSKELDNSIKYTSYIKDYINENLDDTDIRKQLKDITAYCNYLKENLQQTTDYVSYVGENINEYVNITNDNENDIRKLKDSSKNIINYTNYLKENLEIEINTIIAYSEYLKTNINENIQYSDYIAKNINEYFENDNIDDDNHNDKSPKNYRDIINIDEQEDLSATSETIIDKIDKLLEEVKSKKMEDISKINKETVIKNQNAKDWCELLSKDLKEVWDGLDDDTKKVINARSKYYDLSNEYKVKNFWDTYVDPLLNKNNSKNKTIKENNNTNSNKNEDDDDELEKWIGLLPDDKMELWSNLDDKLKDTILLKSKSFNLSDEKKVLNFWNSYAEPLINKNKSTDKSKLQNENLHVNTNKTSNKNDDTEKWIDLLSDDKKEIWDTLTDDLKEKIIAKSKYYDLSDEKKVQSFWNSYVSSLIKTSKSTSKINESKIQYNNKSNKNSDNGYSEDYIENVKKLLNKQNRY